MGFWHTGYIDHHEATGLGEGWVAGPAPISCQTCLAIFPSIEALRLHRSEIHPVRRPVLMIRSLEIGSQAHRISEKLSAADFFVSNCTGATLNGTRVLVADLPEQLSIQRQGTAVLVLHNSESHSDYQLQIQIPTEGDIRGVEACFMELVKRGRLEMRLLGEFADSAKRYSTAIHYCDGLYSYLLGVLIKERAQGTNLRFEDYIHKYNQASEQLRSLRRPLALTVSGLLEFHFNHFEIAAALTPQSRVGISARRIADWMGTTNPIRTEFPVAANRDSFLTERDTGRILDLLEEPIDRLVDRKVELQAALDADTVEYDKCKIHFIMAVVHDYSSQNEPAIRHATRLLHQVPFDSWAQRRLG